MPKLPGSRTMTVGPETPTGSLPVGAEFERVAAAESQAPDPAWIASIANSLFNGWPSVGPGASLPSAPVFAIDPLAAQVPGAPIAAPPASAITLTPGASGVPGPGAARPSAPLHAYEPFTRQGQPTPPQVVPPSGEKGTSGPYVPAPPVPVGSVSDSPVGSPQPVLASEADLASLPSTLGGVISVVPPSDGGISYGGPGASRPAAPINVAEPLHSQAPSVPAPGGTPVSAPVFAFQPLTFVGSPALAGLGQPNGEKSGVSLCQWKAFSIQARTSV
jgi:cysteine desulfurase / selenocysteine lyase